MNDKSRTPDSHLQAGTSNARDGQKTLADYDAEARAVRANMEKLRALRLAKEAAEAASAPARTVRKSSSKKAGAKTKEAPAKLSDWLAEQQKGGFRT
jgi:hypothetical protein